MQKRKLGFTDLELSAIAGARSPAQIEETAKAGDWKLSAEDIAEN